MSKRILLSLVLLPLLISSCNKDYVSSEPVGFNLFLFSRNGTDLINPSSPYTIDAANISIEAQFLDKALTWKQGWSSRYADGLEVVVDLSGFYYYNFFTPDLAEGLDILRNTSFECIIHIQGFPDSTAKFYFDKKGWVYRIDVNGKRVLEPVRSSFNHNIKLEF